MEDTFEPGEALELEALLGHPVTQLFRAGGLAPQPEYMGAGRWSVLGLKVLYPTCEITYSVTARAELVAVNFLRVGPRMGLRSPLADLWRFLKLAAQPAGGIAWGIAKIKMTANYPDALSMSRLTQAYRRVFKFRLLGHDARGFAWIGRPAAEFAADPAVFSYH